MDINKVQFEDLFLGVGNETFLKATGASRSPTLRFSLFILLGELPIAEIEGFRLALGRISPPQRTGTKGGYISMLKTLNSKWDKALLHLINPWRTDSRFANIEFPETEAPATTSE